METLIREAAGLIAASKHPSVFTGAGVSHESGLPTYRDSKNGLWLNHDPGEVATALALNLNPQRVWDFFQKYRFVVRATQPSAGHYALAAMETEHLSGMPVITQNIDDLHERAGSRAVIHLHGQLMRNRCSSYCRGIPSIVEADIAPTEKDIPRCPYCDALLRPDVVLLGEHVHAYPTEQATYIAQHCGLMLVIGTSGVAMPASQIPLVAKETGAILIEINPQPSQITPYVDLHIALESGKVLPRILQFLDECFS